jgi:hypothetical protein
MKVGFADTFWDSLKVMRRHNTWWYKTYELFRYDLPRFFSNIWRFRRGLWGHHWWDHHGMLKFTEAGLIHMSDKLEKNGLEVDESRLKKVEAMRRVIKLIQNYNNDSYIEMSESELGELIHHPWEFEDIEDKPGFSRLVDKETEEEKEHNSKVFERSREIEESEWNELFELLKGQDYSKFNKDEEWSEQFNGSGLRGWWD